MEKGDEGFFTLREDRPRGVKISTNPVQAAADRRAVVLKDIEMIKRRFGGTEKSILLVSHGNLGRIMVEELTGEKKAFDVELKNTGMWMAEEQGDGTFKLEIFNDEPFKGAERGAADAAR